MAAERSTEDDECHNCGRFDDVLDLFSIEEGGRRKMAERKMRTDGSNGGRC
jgi:hypothetical protein